MSLFKKNKNNSNNTVPWRNEDGKIVCNESLCPKGCEPTCPIYIHSEAMKLAHSGKTQEAIELYESALKTAPDFYDAWNNIAGYYGKLGDYFKAYDCFLKAHELNPGKPKPIYGLALASKDTGKYRECIKWCDEYDNLAQDGALDEVRKAAESHLKKAKPSETNKPKEGLIRLAKCGTYEVDPTAGFYKHVIERLHQVFISKGYLNGEIKHVPELFDKSNKVVLKVLRDNKLQTSCGGNPDKYYYIISSLSFYHGISFAEMWHTDYAQFKKTFDSYCYDETVDESCEKLLESFGYSRNKVREMLSVLFNEWADIIMPYMDLPDAREYIYISFEAVFNLGVSFFLEKGFSSSATKSEETDKSVEDLSTVIINSVTECMLNEKVIKTPDLECFSHDAGNMIFYVLLTDRMDEKNADLNNEVFIRKIAKDIFGIGMFAVFYQMRIHKPVSDFSKDDVIDLLIVFDNNGAFETPLKLAGYMPGSRQRTAINNIIDSALLAYFENRCDTPNDDEFVSFLTVLYQAGITIAVNDMKARGASI